MGKIAIDPVADSISRRPTSRLVARGEGWDVSEVVCVAGPMDRPFEEQHSRTLIAVVVEGTFQYRSQGRTEELMTPGSLLLGNPGECFICAHEHGTGDRCLAFRYAPEFFQHMFSNCGAPRMRFRASRLPPIRVSAPLIAKALELLRLGVSTTAFEELSLQVAAQTVDLENGHRNRLRTADPCSVSRVTRVVRTIEHDWQVPSNLTELARLAHLSRYHFLRVFEEITGTTPHQYLLRVRLREAAIRLRTEREKILEIALNCGFGDLSNFNHAFRAEFGLSPRQYRYHSSKD